MLLQVQQRAKGEHAIDYVSRKFEELEDVQRALLGFKDILRAEGLDVTEAEIEAEMGSAAAKRAWRSEDEEEEEYTARLRAQHTLEVRPVLELEAGGWEQGPFCGFETRG